MKKKFSLRAWYTFCFLSEFVLIYPTYLIMMEDSGISPTGLAALLVIWSATTLLFEVPSGVLGDLFPRKYVLLTGAAIEAMAFVVWLVAPSFWGFALGFVLWSFGGSLASGTGEAYLHDILEDKTAYQKVYGRSEAVEGLAVAAALLCGGFLAQEGYGLPLLLSVAAPLTGGLILWLWLPHADAEPVKADQPGAEPASPESLEEEAEPGFRETLVEGGRFTFTHPVVRYIVLAGATVGALAGTFEEYIGVLLAESNIALQHIGMIYASVWFARTLGTLAAARMPATPLHIPLGGMLLTSVLLGLALLTSGAGALYLIVAAVLLYFGAGGLMDVIFGARLQHEVLPRYRATITSFQSMALELAAVICYFLFGAVAQWFNWYATLWVTAALGTILAALWILLGRGTRV